MWVASNVFFFHHGQIAGLATWWAFKPTTRLHEGHRCQIGQRHTHGEINTMRFSSCCFNSPLVSEYQFWSMQ
jgi:hypothetical protein